MSPPFDTRCVRAGIGWRPELAAGILSSLGEIDLVEVIADDYFEASKQEVRALGFLASQVPVWLHGTGMGLASVERVDEKRLGLMARLVEAVRPEGWSEHLAFVRAGGIEIGHLAAPPRTDETLDGLARNVGRARHIVGSSPVLENIATLIDPPASTMSEGSWLCRVIDATGCDLLLDLHNLHANAVNFGFDPLEVLHDLPSDRIRLIHIAGGRWVHPGQGGVARLLDDHLHEVPAPVFALLAHAAALFEGPPAVIVERDGRYPEFELLLDEVRRARETVRQTPAAAPLALNCCEKGPAGGQRYGRRGTAAFRSDPLSSLEAGEDGWRLL